MAAPPLTEGNAAKLYCLQRIDELAASREALTILDLGCGDARNFVTLLRKHHHVRYLGVDPDHQACERARGALAGLDAEILCRPAYDVAAGPADVVVSFSVLEHVYRRRRYLDSVKASLAADGVVFLNYDAGHFVGIGQPGERRVERWKTRLGAALARLGYEAKYQSPVREAVFRSLVAGAGLVIVEEKVFNTDLKSVYKAVPEEARPAYMSRWLDFELYLNTLGIAYRDELGPVFRTRNFVLAHG